MDLEKGVLDVTMDTELVKVSCVSQRRPTKTNQADRSIELLSLFVVKRLASLPPLGFFCTFLQPYGKSI